MQSTPRLSATVADLATSSPVRRSQTGSVGFRCGQRWWSASRRRRRQANTWTATPSRRGSGPLLTSAGSSEEPARTCGAPSRHALTSGKGSRQLSLFPATSRRHVPRMCPQEAVARVILLAVCRLGREQEHCQAAVDIRAPRPTTRLVRVFPATQPVEPLAFSVDTRQERRRVIRRSRLLGEPGSCPSISSTGQYRIPGKR